MAAYRYPGQERAAPYNLQPVPSLRSHHPSPTYPQSMSSPSTFRPPSNHVYTSNYNGAPIASTSSSLYHTGINNGTADAQYEEDSSPGSAGANSRAGQGNIGRAVPTKGPTKRKTSSATNGKGESLDGREFEEEDVQGAQKRKKKAVSCESCRRRKLKCDRGWPCGACRDRSESHLCKWEGGTRPQTQGRDQDNAPLLIRMDRIEDMLGAIAAHVGLNSSASKQAASHQSMTHIDNKERKKGRQAGIIATPASNQCNTQTATCVRNKSMLVTSWLTITNEEARSELLHVLKFLPASNMVLRMCKYYFDEVNYMHYAIDMDDFWEVQMGRHEGLRRRYEDNQDDCLASISEEEIRIHLQFLALLLSVCGLCLLFSDREEFGDVADYVGITPTHGPFFDFAQRALNASNHIEEPTVMSLRVLILQLWAISAVRGPALSMVLLSQALHQMFALELDHEPPKEMAAAERADRLYLYHTLVIIDWFSAGNIKRSYTIREESIKHPYLFKRRPLHERLNGDDPLISQHQWLKLELARLNRRGADRSAMSEAEAYKVTIELQHELDELFMLLPAEYHMEADSKIEALDSNFFKRLGILVALSTQLINLHKQYYIQGWQEAGYRTSRDICFTSARRICSLFKKVFSYDLPMDNIMNLETVDVQASMVSRQKTVSRLWFMSHASVSACLLLQHHYALMDTHPEAAGPNAEQVKREIVEDLCITKRLFLAISPYSQIARAGVAVLTKPDMPMQVQEEDGQACINRAEFESSHDDEATRKRRAKLAMDLQSIIDIDTTTASKLGASRRASSEAGLHNDYQHIYSRPNRVGSTSAVDHIQSKSALPGLTTPRGVASMSEMEALLQSTLSTDLYTGLPLAPEVSFQRQSDRIGLTQPYLPSGMLGPSPSHSNTIVQHSSGHQGTQGNHYDDNVSVMVNNSHHIHPSSREAHPSNWF